MGKKIIYLLVLVFGLSLFASSNECSIPAKSLACTKMITEKGSSTAKAWTAAEAEEITPPVHFLLCHL